MPTKVKILPVNKTVVFNSPLEGDEDTLVRTGTIGEGSCFFHSVMCACSKEYCAMDRKGRMKFVKRLRASMAGNVTRYSWEEMGGGLIAKIPYQEKVYDILTKFYDFMSSSDGGDARGRSTRRVVKKLIKGDVENLELYRLITELIPLDEGYNQVILKNAYDNTSDMKIEDSKKAVIKETIKYINAKSEFNIIDPDKAEYLRSVITNFNTTIMNEAESSTFSSYVKNLQSVEANVDTYTIGLISDRIERDIYIIDGSTRLPYRNASVENLQFRKSIIVVWVEKNHYEVVGRLLPGNRIQREFDKGDPIIDKIYTMLVKPDKVAERYPSLVPYLPREYQHSDDEESDDELNNSESEQESDKYYDSSDNDSEYEGSYVGSDIEDEQENGDDGPSNGEDDQENSDDDPRNGEEDQENSEDDQSGGY